MDRQSFSLPGLRCIEYTHELGQLEPVWVEEADKGWAECPRPFQLRRLFWRRSTLRISPRDLGAVVSSRRTARNVNMVANAGNGSSVIQSVGGVHISGGMDHVLPPSVLKIELPLALRDKVNFRQI